MNSSFITLRSVYFFCCQIRNIVFQLTPVTFVVLFYVLFCVTFCPFHFSNHLDGEERASCFALFVFLVSSCDCVALPCGTTGLSAVCDCGIS